MAINTTSLNNTPQACDDNYSYTQEELLASSLYNSATNVVVLDVMSNDLGGKAKKLFSIDEGSAGFLNDLLTNNVNTGWETLIPSGNRIQIVNGRIQLDISASLDGRGVESLAAGETITETFVYSIQLGNGTLSWARVTFTVVGENDAATITASSTEDACVTEAGGMANGATGDPSTGGQLTVHDVDRGEAQFRAVAPASLVGTYGDFTFDAATGAWHYTLDQSRADALTAGQQATETLTVTSADGTASHTITVDIVGSNDVATINSPDTGDVAEDGSSVASGTLTVHDVDAGENHFQTPAALAGSYGDFSFDVTTGEWIYTLDNTRAQSLSDGQTAHDYLTVTSADGTASDTIDVTITGTNDAPVITSAPQSGAVSEGDDGASRSATGQVAFSDVDASDSHSFSVSSAAAYGTASVDADGTWHYTVTDAGAVDALAAGEHLADSFTVLVDDHHGGATSQVVTLDITGTNDAPLAAASADAASEGGAVLNGQVTASDVDAGASLTYSLTDPPPAGLSFHSDGSYSFDPTVSAYEHLSAGATQDVVVHYMANDGLADSNVATLTITVTGTNDAPVAMADAGSGTEDGLVLTGSVAANDRDADDGALLSYSLDAPVAGLTINTDGSYSFDLSNAAYQHLAQGASTDVVASYTVTDEHGASSTSTLTITVIGTNDAPVVSGVVTGNATEDGSAVTLDALADSSDVDDGTTLMVVNLPSALPAGVTFDAATHSFTLDPSHAGYQHLAAGQTMDVTIAYGVSDGIATTPESATFTITGTNDAPVVSGAVTGAATEDDASVSLSALAHASDVDDGTTLSVTDLGALPAGVTFDAATNSFALDPSNAAFQHLAAGTHATVTVNYGVTDGTATTAASVSWDVTGSNDAPLAAAVSNVATEGGAAINGNVAATDADDGTSLSYSLTAAAPAGLSFNADGSYSFDPTVSAYDHLAAGVTQDVVVGYRANDGTADSNVAALTITVTGTNDAAVLGADTKNLTETNAVLSTGGTLSISDVDSPATFVAQAGTAGSYGTFAINAAGAWTYAASSAHNEFAAGTTYTDTFSVASADGTLTSVTINIAGTNDAATNLTLTGTAAANNGLPSGAFASFTPTDPDGGGSHGYSMSLVEYNASTLATISDGTPDLSLSSSGVLSATSGTNGIENNRVYELQVTVTQGGTTYTEAFSVFTGTTGGDTINSGFTAGDDAMYVLNGADVVLAGNGDDSVRGQNGTDEIHGGDGNDVLSGGGGNDTFVFDTALNAATNVDRITDFDANGNDHIALDASFFSCLSVATPLAAANFLANAGGLAADADDYILYDTATGNLYYDADGNGAGERVLFATLTLAGVTGTVDSTDFTVLS